MEEASIFVHVAISDVSGKVSATRRAICPAHPCSHPGPVARLSGLVLTPLGLCLRLQNGQ